MRLATAELAENRRESGRNSTAIDMLTLLIVGMLLGFAFKGNSASDDGLNTMPIGEMDLGRRVKGEPLARRWRTDPFESANHAA